MWISGVELLSESKTEPCSKVICVTISTVVAMLETQTDGEVESVDSASIF